MQSHTVRQYFCEKTVLLTGATGFLGQFIVFKLIKLCAVANIFIVLRPKNNETVEQRFSKFLNNEIFSSIDRELLREKIIAVKGDVTKELLGFTEVAFERIKDTDLFIHSAASIRLSATFVEALLSNTNTTRNALQVCKHLPKLQKFVHVSTAYAFGENVLEEKVHEFPLSANEINEVLDCYLNNNEVNETLSKKLESKSLLNNYCVSKTLSEIIVAKESEHVQTLIFRPSVVIPSIEEPFTGWFEGSQIITNIATYVSTGLWRVSNLNPEQLMAVIPVDICGNALLTAISSQSHATVSQPSLYVMNAVTDCIELEYIFKQFIRLSKVHPMPKILRPIVREYKGIKNENYFRYKRWFVESLFAVCMDFVLHFSGSRKIVTKRVLQMHGLLEAIKQCSRFCEFRNRKFCDLWKQCCHEDKQLFNCNPFGIHMDKIMASTYLQLRQKMNSGKEVDEEEARKRVIRVNIVHNVLICLPFIFMILLLAIFYSN